MAGPDNLSPRQVKGAGDWAGPGSLCGGRAGESLRGPTPCPFTCPRSSDAGSEWRRRSQGRGPPRYPGLGAGAALASAALSPRPERGAAGGIPAISSAPRGMWPARCPTAARPGGGGRRRGPVTSRVWQLPRPRRPAPDSRLAAPRPGRPNRPWSGPGPARRCREPRLLPARPQPAESLPPHARLPPRSPPRTLPRGSPESQFETEGGLCYVTLGHVP